jgi:type I restriction enzyme S subunit
VNWPTVDLGEIALSVRNGIFVRRPSDEPGGSRILRISAVRDGHVNLGDTRCVTGLGADQVEQFSIDPGDLLVTRYNGSRHLVGTSGIVPRHDGHVIHPDKLIRVVVDRNRVDPRFVNYQFQSPQVRAHLEPRIRTTAGQSGIAGADVRSVPIVLPPLDEQVRIVEFLEDQLSRLDAAQAGVGISIKRLAALRQATLVAAIREAQSCGDCTRIQLGELADVTTGMTPLKSNKAYYDGGTIPWITSGDLHRGAIDSASQFVTDKALAETSLKLIPAGAILVAMYGEGKTRGTAADLTIEATTNQACAAVVLKDHSLQRWVRLVLDANYDAMRRLAAGGVQPNLNLSLVRAIEIPIPPPIVRSAILSRVADIDAAIGELKDSLGAASVRGTLLRQSLLTAAFSGRLTPARQHLDTEDLVSP